jgi:hypothetical protein
VRHVSRKRAESAATVPARRTPEIGLQKRTVGADGMAQGTVKWFSDEKGYGFISRTTVAKTSSSTTPV